MDLLNHIDIKSMVLPMLYFKWPNVNKCKSGCIPILDDSFNVSRDNANHDEITHDAALVVKHLCIK